MLNVAICQLTTLDWAILGVYLGVTFYLGLFIRRLGTKDATHYFLAKRKLPWWLGAAGFGASATATDTPMWYAYLIYNYGVRGIFVSPDYTHGLASLLYARRFRALRVWTLPHLEEKRWGGLAAVLARASWAAGAINGSAWTLAWINYATGLIFNMLLDWDPMFSTIFVSSATWLYTFVSGAWGVATTEMMQFVWLLTAFAVVAYFTISAAGGFANIMAHEPWPGFFNPFHSTPDWPLWFTILLIWHQFLYGWGELGYGAGMQKVFSSKDLIHASFTGIADCIYIQIRDFIWGIAIVAAATVLMPNLPALEAQKVWYYCAFAYTPPGVRGFILAGIMAIYMAAVSVQLNVAGNYFAWDWYKRFFNPKASDTRVIWVGRIAGSYVLALSWYIAWVYYYYAAFPIGYVYAYGAIIGASTGWPWVLKWLWWRVNMWSLMAKDLINQILYWMYMVWPAGAALGGWVLTVYLIGLGGSWALFFLTLYLTKPDPIPKLAKLYEIARPPGFWGPVKKYVERMEAESR